MRQHDLIVRWHVANGSTDFFFALAYYEQEPGRRAAAGLLTRDEVRRIAANIARLPQLLGAEQPEGNPLVQRRP